MARCAVPVPAYTQPVSAYTATCSQLTITRSHLQYTHGFRCDGMSRIRISQSTYFALLPQHSQEELGMYSFFIC